MLHDIIASYLKPWACACVGLFLQAERLRLSHVEAFLADLRQCPVELGKLVGCITWGLKTHIGADVAGVFVHDTETHELFKAPNSLSP